jgi:hypothetical protein
MKFQLVQHGWATKGGGMIPQGTIIDTADPVWAEVMEIHGAMPPPNGMALDQATFELMKTVYPVWSILTGPDVVR